VDGLERVEDIAVGETLFGYDIDEQNLVNVTVLNTFVRTSDHYYELVTQSGITLQVTAEHPLYTSNGYKRVKTLKSGDTLFRHTGTGLVPDTIVHLQRIKKTLKVYNFHTSDTQNYFAEWMLVHNKHNPCKDYITCAKNDDDCTNHVDGTPGFCYHQSHDNDDYGSGGCANEHTWWSCDDVNYVPGVTSGPSASEMYEECCKKPECGDGELNQPNEVCEPPGSSCTTSTGEQGTCTSTCYCYGEPYCGDGTVQRDRGEVCEKPGDTFATMAECQGESPPPPPPPTEPPGTPTQGGGSTPPDVASGEPGPGYTGGPSSGAGSAGGSAGGTDGAFSGGEGNIGGTSAVVAGSTIETLFQASGSKELAQGLPEITGRINIPGLPIPPSLGGGEPAGGEEDGAGGEGGAGGGAGGAMAPPKPVTCDDTCHCYNESENCGCPNKCPVPDPLEKIPCPEREEEDDAERNECGDGKPTDASQMMTLTNQANHEAYMEYGQSVINNALAQSQGRPGMSAADLEQRYQHVTIEEAIRLDREERNRQALAAGAAVAKLAGASERYPGITGRTFAGLTGAQGYQYASSVPGYQQSGTGYRSAQGGISLVDGRPVAYGPAEGYHAPNANPWLSASNLMMNQQDSISAPSGAAQPSFPYDPTATYNAVTASGGVQSYITSTLAAGDPTAIKENTLAINNYLNALSQQNPDLASRVAAKVEECDAGDKGPVKIDVPGGMPDISTAESRAKADAQCVAKYGVPSKCDKEKCKCIPPCPTQPGPLHPHPLISEIGYNFIEIYNPTEFDVDLGDGWGIEIELESTEVPEQPSLTYEEFMQIVDTWPAPGEEQIPPAAQVFIAYSEDVDFASVSSATVQVTSAYGVVQGTYEVANNLITFTPASELAPLTAYTVRAENVVAASGRQSSPGTFSFVTGEALAYPGPPDFCSMTLESEDGTTQTLYSPIGTALAEDLKTFATVEEREAWQAEIVANTSIDPTLPRVAIRAADDYDPYGAGQGMSPSDALLYSTSPCADAGLYDTLTNEGAPAPEREAAMDLLADRGTLDPEDLKTIAKKVPELEDAALGKARELPQTVKIPFSTMSTESLLKLDAPPGASAGLLGITAWAAFDAITGRAALEESLTPTYTIALPGMKKGRPVIREPRIIKLADIPAGQTPDSAEEALSAIETAVDTALAPPAGDTQQVDAAVESNSAGMQGLGTMKFMFSKVAPEPKPPLTDEEKAQVEQYADLESTDARFREILTSPDAQLSPAEEACRTQVQEQARAQETQAGVSVEFRLKDIPLRNTVEDMPADIPVSSIDYAPSAFSSCMQDALKGLTEQYNAEQRGEQVMDVSASVLPSGGIKVIMVNDEFIEEFGTAPDFRVNPSEYLPETPVMMLGTAGGANLVRVRIAQSGHAILFKGGEPGSISPDSTGTPEVTGGDSGAPAEETAPAEEQAVPQETAPAEEVPQVPQEAPPAEETPVQPQEELPAELPVPEQTPVEEPAATDAGIDKLLYYTGLPIGVLRLGDEPKSGIWGITTLAVSELINDAPRIERMPDPGIAGEAEAPAGPPWGEGIIDEVTHYNLDPRPIEALHVVVSGFTYDANSATVRIKNIGTGQYVFTNELLRVKAGGNFWLDQIPYGYWLNGGEEGVFVFGTPGGEVAPSVFLPQAPAEPPQEYAETSQEPAEELPPEQAAETAVEDLECYPVPSLAKIRYRPGCALKSETLYCCPRTESDSATTPDDTYAIQPYEPKPAQPITGYAIADIVLGDEPESTPPGDIVQEDTDTSATESAGEMPAPLTERPAVYTFMSPMHVQYGDLMLLTEVLFLGPGEGLPEIPGAEASAGLDRKVLDYLLLPAEQAEYALVTLGGSVSYESVPGVLPTNGEGTPQVSKPEDREQDFERILSPEPAPPMRIIKPGPGTRPVERTECLNGEERVKANPDGSAPRKDCRRLDKVSYCCGGKADYSIMPVKPGPLPLPAERAVCPTGLRQCPDGTFVGRELPDCSFGSCTGSAAQRIRMPDLPGDTYTTLPYELKSGVSVTGSAITGRVVAETSELGITPQQVKELLARQRKVSQSRERAVSAVNAYAARTKQDSGQLIINAETASRETNRTPDEVPGADVGVVYAPMLREILSGDLVRSDTLASGDLFLLVADGTSNSATAAGLKAIPNHIAELLLAGNVPLPNGSTVADAERALSLLQRPDKFLELVHNLTRTLYAPDATAEFAVVTFFPTAGRARLSGARLHIYAIRPTGEYAEYNFTETIGSSRRFNLTEIPLAQGEALLLPGYGLREQVNSSDTAFKDSVEFNTTMRIIALASADSGAHTLQFAVDTHRGVGMPYEQPMEDDYGALILKVTAAGPGEAPEARPAEEAAVPLPPGITPPPGVTPPPGITPPPGVTPPPGITPPQGITPPPPAPTPPPGITPPPPAGIPPTFQPPSTQLFSKTWNRVDYEETSENKGQAAAGVPAEFQRQGAMLERFGTAQATAVSEQSGTPPKIRLTGAAIADVTGAQGYQLASSVPGYQVSGTGYRLASSVPGYYVQPSQTVQQTINAVAPLGTSDTSRAMLAYEIISTAGTRADLQNFMQSPLVGSAKEELIRQMDGAKIKLPSFSAEPSLRPAVGERILDAATDMLTSAPAGAELYGLVDETYNAGLDARLEKIRPGGGRGGGSGGSGTGHDEPSEDPTVAGHIMEGTPGGLPPEEPKEPPAYGVPPVFEGTEGDRPAPGGLPLPQESVVPGIFPQVTPEQQAIGNVLSMQSGYQSAANIPGYNMPTASGYQLASAVQGYQVSGTVYQLASSVPGYQLPGTGYQLASSVPGYQQQGSGYRLAQGGISLVNGRPAAYGPTEDYLQQGTGYQTQQIGGQKPASQAQPSYAPMEFTPQINTVPDSSLIAQAEAILGASDAEIMDDLEYRDNFGDTGPPPEFTTVQQAVRALYVLEEGKGLPADYDTSDIEAAFLSQDSAVQNSLSEKLGKMRLTEEGTPSCISGDMNWNNAETSAIKDIGKKFPNELVDAHPKPGERPETPPDPIANEYARLSSYLSGSSADFQKFIEEAFKLNGKVQALGQVGSPLGNIDTSRLAQLGQNLDNVVTQLNDMTTMLGNMVNAMNGNRFAQNSLSLMANEDALKAAGTYDGLLEQAQLANEYLGMKNNLAAAKDAYKNGQMSQADFLKAQQSFKHQEQVRQCQESGSRHSQAGLCRLGQARRESQREPGQA
jgi:hypothetical protein